MTQNQLAYQRLLEEQRSNKAKEVETQRANQESERETRYRDKSKNFVDIWRTILGFGWR